MSDASALDAETDPRFPSGKWTGYYTMPHTGKQRHGMDLNFAFRQGVIEGDGRDPVGGFALRGRYELESGACHWTKRYLGKHDVFYNGFNEGKGIWGTWEIPNQGFRWTGGFHVWPEYMGDPTQPAMAAAEELPVAYEDEVPADPELVPAGAGAQDRSGC